VVFAPRLSVTVNRKLSVSLESGAVKNGVGLSTSKLGSFTTEVPLIWVHRYVVMLPSLSWLWVPSKLTIWDSSACISEPAFATGKLLSITRTLTSSLLTKPVSSVTFNSNVNSSSADTDGEIKSGVASSTPLNVTIAPLICLHLYARIAPSESRLLLPFSWTAWVSNTLWSSPASATGSKPWILLSSSLLPLLHPVKLTANTNIKVKKRKWKQALWLYVIVFFNLLIRMYIFIKR